VTECGPRETGAIYNIQIIDVFYAERKLCGILPICQILLSANFSIEDAEHTVESVDQITQDIMCVDDSHSFPPVNVSVKLHYDRRDQVRIFGDVWTDYPNRFSWQPGIVLTGTLTNGIKGSTRWNSVRCHRFGVRYRVTKTGVLTD